MKKYLTLVLAVVMSLLLLTGCGDPVFDEFENFLNVEMSEVNENYERIKAEAARWGEMEEVAEITASITETLIPLVDDSIEKVSAIELKAEEVKDIKAKYLKVMEAYREGFGLILTAIEEDDVDKINAGDAKISEAIELLDEYNTGLKTLAEEVGATIEY